MSGPTSDRNGPQGPCLRTARSGHRQPEHANGTGWGGTGRGLGVRAEGRRRGPGAWGHLAASRPLSGGLGPLMAGSATRGHHWHDSDARQPQATAGQGGAHASLGLGPYTPNRRPLHSSSARPGRHSVGRCSRPSLRGAFEADRHGRASRGSPRPTRQPLGNVRRDTECTEWTVNGRANV